MSSSECNESYVELAVDVFKTQNLTSIKALKDFLTVLSNPLAVETVLKGAIYQLAENDPKTCRWLLGHPSYLLPDLDLVDWAHTVVFSQLQECRLLSEREVGFNVDGKLYISPSAASQLFAEISMGDRLLLEEVLHLRS